MATRGSERSLADLCIVLPSYAVKMATLAKLPSVVNERRMANRLSGMRLLARRINF